MTFKVGDWVRVTADVNRPSYICKIKSISHSWNPCEQSHNGPLCINGSLVPLPDVTAWTPQPDEWCWFWDYDKDNPRLAQYRKMSHTQFEAKCNDFENYEILGHYNFCEPFLGELPSFLQYKG